jgi:hypothetical protein
MLLIVLESVDVRLFHTPEAYFNFDLIKALYKTIRLSVEEKYKE